MIQGIGNNVALNQAKNLSAAPDIKTRQNSAMNGPDLKTRVIADQVSFKGEEKQEAKEPQAPKQNGIKNLFSKLANILHLGKKEGAEEAKAPAQPEAAPKAEKAESKEVEKD